MLRPTLSLEVSISKNRHGPCVHRVYNPAEDKSIVKITRKKYNWKEIKCCDGTKNSLMTKLDQFKSHWEKATWTGKHRINVSVVNNLS